MLIIKIISELQLFIVDVLDECDLVFTYEGNKRM